jgi:class 3 adenylate cyclase
LVLLRGKAFGQYQWLSATVNCFVGINGSILNFLVIRNSILGTLFVIINQVVAFFGIRKRFPLAVISTLLFTGVSQLIMLSGSVSNDKSVLLMSLGIWIIEFFLVTTGHELDIAARKHFVEQNTKDELLSSILPVAVADQLKATGSSRPVRIESATILFSDFVHFTSTTKGIEPISVIALLNGYFTAFDGLAQTHKIERLKTIGDGYMCAGGVPDKSNTHPIDVLLMALEMLRYVKDQMKQNDSIAWDIRIGINTGSVTAGIIGSSKFSYDIWGEAVNMASRHESSGIEGGINVSKGTYLLTKSFFDYRPRGPVEIKGGEKLDMYELVGVKERYLDSSGNLRGEFLEVHDKINRGELLLGFDV